MKEWKVIDHDGWPRFDVPLIVTVQTNREPRGNVILYPVYYKISEAGKVSLDCFRYRGNFLQSEVDKVVAWIEIPTKPWRNE